MQYLILRSFRSYDKYLEKGTVVDEKEIRSPRLRRSEGKIIPAVPSFNVPVSDDVPQSHSQDILGDSIDKKPAFKLSFNR